MKGMYKWLLMIVLLTVMVSFFTYRLTMESLGEDVPTSSSINKEEVELNEEFTSKFKKAVDYSPEKIPDHQVLKKKQQAVFDATPQIRSIRSSIGVLHQELDYKLRPEAFVNMKEDGNAKAWEGFYGRADQTGNGVREMISRIDNIISKLDNELLLRDLKKVQELLLTGTEKKDVFLLWEAHKIVHDLDYFLFNYPVVVKTGVGSIKESFNGPEQYWNEASFLNN